MDATTLLAFSAFAGLAVVSPGPAILLALRNSVAFGVRAAVWSSLGNIAGIFCLSAAAMLGLGVLLQSSAMWFGALKWLGALYLFYVGIRHLAGRASVGLPACTPTGAEARPGRVELFREAFLMAATNPKPILFFTALFPQFIKADVHLLPQFFFLTGIFMALSFLTLVAYALVAVRARTVLQRPCLTQWINRVVGAVFIAFGAGLLALRRPAA